MGTSSSSPVSVQLGKPFLFYHHYFNSLILQASAVFARNTHKAKETNVEGAPQGIPNPQQAGDSGPGQSFCPTSCGGPSCTPGLQHNQLSYGVTCCFVLLKPSFYNDSLEKPKATLYLKSSLDMGSAGPLPSLQQSVAPSATNVLLVISNLDLKKIKAY